MAISTNGTVLARVAGALYNTQMSNATYAEVAALDPNTLVNTLYARDFSTSTDLSVATTLVTNLGLTSVTGLANWVAAQLTAAGSAKGAKVVELLNGFAQMTADTTYGAYATAFNTKVDAALALSQTAGNKGGTFAAAGVVVPTAPANATFALTAGIDAIAGGAGNDTITATPTTLTAADSINGGDGTDTLNITGALTAALPAGVTLTSVEKVTAVSTSTIGANSGGTGATAQINYFTFSGTQTATDRLVVNVGSNSTTVIAGGTGATDIAHAYAAALAGVGLTTAVGTVSSSAFTADSNQTTGTGTVVRVTAPTAGTALPSISFVSASAAVNYPVVNSGIAGVANAASSTVNAVQYDLSSTTFYAGVTDFSGTSDGGVNVKLQKTTNATLVNTTGGAVNLDGGKAVAITTTGTSAVGVTSKGATTVAVTGGTGATIDNVEDSTAATTALGTTMTSVTLTNVDGNSAVKGQGLTTLTVGGATTGARTITVTDAAVGHSLNVVAAGTGYDSTGATTYRTVVTDAAARTITVTSSGAKNAVDLTNNTAMTGLSINGSAALNASVSVSSLTSIDGSAATGNLTLGTLNAATRTIKGGAGNDSMTVAATATVNIDTGAGNDTVSLTSAVAAGSTVTLSAGNDKLLNVYDGTNSVWLGSVASGYNSTTGVATTIDGGDGTNAVAASLVNGGNSAIFKNFQTLVLDNLSGSFDSTLIAGITGLEIASAAGGTYTGLTQAQALTVTNTATPTGTTTLTMTGVSGTSDAYAITFSGSAQTSVPSGANIKAGTVAVAGIENTTIVSGGSTNTWNSLTLGANTSGRTITISGDKNLDLAFASGGFGEVSSANGTTGVSSIDGSAATGKLAINLTYVVPATAGLSVKGGSAVDTFTTSAKATLTLGAGADAVNIAVSKVGTLADTTNNIATEAEATAKLITITDVAAGDTIDFSAGITAAGALGSATSVGSATTLLAALNALANAGGTGGGLEMAWGVYGGNTYVVLDAAASSTSAGIQANDVVLKLTGIVDLSGSTLDTGAILTIV